MLISNLSLKDPTQDFHFSSFFSSCNPFDSPVCMVLSVSFMTSPDILCIFRHLIIQLDHMIYFLESMHAIGKFFRLVLLSSRMFRSMYWISPLPLVHLSFLFLRELPQLISELKISSLIYVVSIFHIIGRRVMGLQLLGWASGGGLLNRSGISLCLPFDYIYFLSYLPNPSARAGYDTRSIFKRSLTGLNSEFFFLLD